MILKNIVLGTACINANKSKTVRSLSAIHLYKLPMMGISHSSFRKLLSESKVVDTYLITISAKVFIKDRPDLANKFIPSNRLAMVISKNRSGCSLNCEIIFSK